MSDIFDCECGCIILKKSLKAHLKTKIHKDFIIMQDNKNKRLNEILNQINELFDNKDNMTDTDYIMICNQLKTDYYQLKNNTYFIDNYGY